MKKHLLLLFVVAIACMTLLCACSVKDSEPADIPKHTHTYTKTTIPPTCGTDGYDEHICSGCNDYYTDNIKPALGHDYVERTQNYKCSICDKYEDDGFTFELITPEMGRYNEYYANRINTYQITSVSSKALDGETLSIPRKHLGYEVSGLAKGSLYNVRKSIKVLRIPSATIYIGSSLFNYDGGYVLTNDTFTLEKIVFDSNCKNICISHSAFSFCKKVTDISYPRGCFTSFNHDDNIGNHFLFEDTQYYSNNVAIVDGLCYLNEMLLSSERSQVGAAVNVRAGTTLIANQVFVANTNIKSVNIPQSVIYIGKRAFADCVSLKTINYSGTSEQYEQICVESNAFDEVSIENYNYN